MGAVAGLVYLDRQSTVDAHCDATHFCDRAGLDAAHSKDTYATWSTVGWVAGGTASAVALYLLLRHHDKPSASASSIEWTAGAGIGAATLGVRGAF
jgi:hypothetical protein